MSEAEAPVAKVKPRLTYLICTGPRTGSTLLASALSGTGIAGRPAEYFDAQPEVEAYWRQHLAIRNEADYFGKVVGAAMTGNGVMGVKLHWHQAITMRKQLLAEGGLAAEAGSKSLDGLLRARLGDTRYVWLRRRNALAQAISYYRASRTARWHLAAGETAASIPVPYDHGEIERHLKLVEGFNRAWYQFFLRERLKALVLVYEDFVQSYDATVRGVLGFLGLDDPALAIPLPGFARQADDESTEWEQRYQRGSSPPSIAKATQRQSRPVKPDLPEMPLVVYDLGTGIDLPIEPASPLRAWMSDTDQRFAYRCLPMVIANQSGWFIRGTHAVTAVWNGSDRPDGVSVRFEGAPAVTYASGHFGCGILTFTLAVLFRSPPGYNLHVRGPANWPRDGIAPLEGIIETDWVRSTFTMNWRFTRPDHPVTFAAGDPIAMFSLVQRGEQERVRPEMQPIAADADWHEGFLEWSGSRTKFQDAVAKNEPVAVAAGWQRHYQFGVGPAGQAAPEHQTALRLATMRDKRPGRG